MKILHVAIIIGISVTVAMTTVFLPYVQSAIFPIHIEIDGLKDKYQRGDPIDFFVNVTGYGPVCEGPVVKIFNATNQVVWQGHYPAYSGMYCNSHTVDLVYHAGGDPFTHPPVNSPIVLTKTGQYTVNATIGKKFSEKQFSVINQLPKGSQVDLTNVSVWTCGAGRKIATFVDTRGFINITKANEYAGGLPVDLNDFFDFILKPNSTGYINMSFEFIGENHYVNNVPFNGTIQFSISSQQSTISDLFNKTAIYTLDDPYSPHASNLDGIRIFTTNIENVTNHTLRLTYVIKIDSSAKEGTYGIGIPYTCPIELLTVGDHPYTGSIPWHRGTY
ncbi:MAG: hypothetical protein ACREBI_07775 [Nitrosotalea sp.]